MESSSTDELRRRLGGRREQASYVRVRRWFLFVLGVGYLAAFLSLWGQVHGLYGSDGLLPLAEYLDAIRQRYGADASSLYPSLFWLGAGDTALTLACAAGTALSLLLLSGFARRPALIGLWLLYLSFVTVGRVFLNYQWDALLLEIGFLAIFFAPGTLGRDDGKPPSQIILWLLRWLLFRLMLSVGLGQMLSDDPAWINLEVLDYHFFTQPLPSWLSWYAQGLPPWAKDTGLAFALATEVVVPLFIFATRSTRLVAFFLLAGLQLAIMAAGNQGFFNLLVLAMCLCLLDDQALPVLPGRDIPAWLRGRLQGLAGALEGLRSPAEDDEEPDEAPLPRSEVLRRAQGLPAEDPSGGELASGGGGAVAADWATRDRPGADSPASVEAADVGDAATAASLRNAGPGPVADAGENKPGAEREPAAGPGEKRSGGVRHSRWWGKDSDTADRPEPSIESRVRVGKESGRSAREPAWTPLRDKEAATHWRAIGGGEDDEQRWSGDRGVQVQELWPPTAGSVAAALLAFVLVINGSMQSLMRLGYKNPPSVATALMNVLRPYRLTASYGLFDNVVRERREIVIEGSGDGEKWRRYRFKYKPGDVSRAPAFAGLDMPRLDWQMWEAAQTNFSEYGWTAALERRLLEGAPDVVALLAGNPFPERPPLMLRATLYSYEFTDEAERRETGNWWRRSELGPYSPVVRLDSFDR